MRSILINFRLAYYNTNQDYIIIKNNILITNYAILLLKIFLRTTLKKKTIFI